MTVALLNKKDFLKKLEICIKKVRDNKEVTLTMLTTPSAYDEVFSIMKNHHTVDHMRFQHGVVFMMDELRIEIKKIDGYV